MSVCVPHFYGVRSKRVCVCVCRGASWGEAGYIKLFREPANKPTCGPDKSPQDGSGCDNGPSEITVCGTCGILYDNTYPIPA